MPIFKIPNFQWQISNQIQNPNYKIWALKFELELTLEIGNLTL